MQTAHEVAELQLDNLNTSSKKVRSDAGMFDFFDYSFPNFCGGKS
jgi:hypothetical protein